MSLERGRLVDHPGPANSLNFPHKGSRNRFALAESRLLKPVCLAQLAGSS